MERCRYSNNDRYHIYLNASATVEATFIIPIMIIVIIALFWLMFFMYARIKLEADSDMSAERTAELMAVADTVDMDRIRKAHPEKYISEYPYYDVVDRSILYDDGKITVRSQLGLSGPDKVSPGFISGRINMIRYSRNLKCRTNPKIKRIIHTILDNTG